MNNARCKSVLLTSLLLLSSIPYIYARDNGPVTDELTPSADFFAHEEHAKEPAKSPSEIPQEQIDDLNQNHIEQQTETPQEQSANLPTTETVQKSDDQNAYDFTLPIPSASDEQALQNALTQDLVTISADKDVQQLLNKANNEMLEKYNEYSLRQLQQLDCILEEIATNLSSNNLIPTRNSGSALQKIAALRAILSDIKIINIYPLKAKIIFIIAKQIQDIANYMRMNLEKGIDQCPQYNMANFNPQALNESEDVEQQLQTVLVENNRVIEQLNAKASRVGLHIYNMAWRWMHKKVFDPWKKYNLTQVTLGSAWLTSAAFFTWYYFGGQKVPGLPERFGKWLRNRVGWPAQSHDDYIINDPNSTISANQYIAEELEKARKGNWWKSGLSADEIAAILNEAGRKVQEGPYINYKESLNKPVGWLGRFEHRISQFTMNKFIVGSMVLFPTGQALLSTVAPSLLNWFDKTVQKVDNFLLGGVYRNKRVDDIIMHANARFKDVIGYESHKKVFREIIEYLKNPEAWERSRIAPKTGILLYGPTRTGKSFIIDAFFGELIDEFGAGAGFKLWPISYTLILEKGIDWVLEQAREYAPCIIVIEEIDLLGLQRTENKQLLASFMTALNSCLQHNTIDKTVIVIATTNRLENIELALRQDGRLGLHLYFTYPKHAERKLFTEQELNNLAVTIEQFDTEHLACLTEGCAYEQIRTMIKGALTDAKLGREAVSQGSLERSLERLVYGISLDPCKLDVKQKRIIATHLAGEIIATQLLDSDLHIAKATIKNVSAKIEEQSVYLQYFESTKQNPVEYGKVFYCHDHDILPLNSKDDKIKQCKIYRAGHAAETIILGTSSDYHPSDKHRSYEFALAASGEGLDISKLPQVAQNQFFDQAYKMVAQCEIEIQALLEQHKDEINAIAKLLIEKQTIGESDINKIIKKQDGFGTDDNTPQA